MAIDWEMVAAQVGDISPEGVGRFSTESGRRAIETLLGEENVRDAVDYWISQKPGCFTAEMVLSIMRMINSKSDGSRIRITVSTLNRTNRHQQIDRLLPLI